MEWKFDTFPQSYIESVWYLSQVVGCGHIAVMGGGCLRKKNFTQRTRIMTALPLIVKSTCLRFFITSLHSGVGLRQISIRCYNIIEANLPAYIV